MRIPTTCIFCFLGLYWFQVHEDTTQAERILQLGKRMCSEAMPCCMDVVKGMKRWRGENAEAAEEERWHGFIIGKNGRLVRQYTTR